MTTKSIKGEEVVFDAAAIRFAAKHQMKTHALEYAKAIRTHFKQAQTIHCRFYRDPEFRKECWLSFEVQIASDAPTILRELESFEEAILTAIPASARRFMLLSYHVA